MAAMIFAGGVTILIIGFLWFYIARPMLEDFGLIVNDIEDEAIHVMSRSDVVSPPSAPSSLGTDGATDGRTAQPARVNAEQLLTLYKLMREHGIKRDEAASALRVAGLPLSNDVWANAAPDDDVLVTPYAGRRTRASYYPDDPELEFKSPA